MVALQDNQVTLVPLAAAAAEPRAADPALLELAGVLTAPGGQPHQPRPLAVGY
jgi:hypothetical protein